MMNSFQYRELYPTVPCGCSDEELRKRLTNELRSARNSSSSYRNSRRYFSEEELSAESGNDWHSMSVYLYFRCRNSGKFIGTEVNHTSFIPISDKVLTTNGEELLSSNALIVIRRLSVLFVDSGRIHVNNGAFGCIFPLLDDKVAVHLTGDRPFSYFYSCNDPDLKAVLFYTFLTSPNGREIRFVKMGREGHLLSEEFREQLLYLLPPDGHWCNYVTTKLLLLDWQFSFKIEVGEGRNVFIFPSFISTTALKTGMEGNNARSKKLPISTNELDVHHGFVENVPLEEKIYHPAVVQKVKELAGKQVEICRVIPGVREGSETCRQVKKSMKKYEELLGKIKGRWPRTVTDLHSRLSFSITKLMVAGIYDLYVRERFPEPKCFLDSVKKKEASISLEFG